MRDPAIHDVRGGDTLGEGSDAALGFRGHATGNNAVVDELSGFRQLELPDQRLR